jgi:hypothetical protein
MTSCENGRWSRVSIGTGLVALSLIVAGCSGIREQISGTGKYAPDEFSVVSRAPLTLPPDYGLRPPEPGALRPQDTRAQDVAKAALLGAGAPLQSTANASIGEQALLGRAGSADADPGIRRIINEESAIYAEDDDTFVNNLMFWRDKEQPGLIVDPTKENRRLEEATALGDDPTEGETAVIERRQKGILEGVFN